MVTLASITAKPFFEKQGFHVVKEKEVMIRGCKLKNFKMQKSYRDSFIFIRRLRDRDIFEMVEAFIKSHWTLKSKELFDKYLLEKKIMKELFLSLLIKINLQAMSPWFGNLNILFSMPVKFQKS